MTQDLVHEAEAVNEGSNDCLGSVSEERQPTPRRRRWLWALSCGVFIAIAAGVMAFVSPGYRSAAVAAFRSLHHQSAEVAATPQPPIVRTAVVVAASRGEARFTGVVHARYESGLGFRVSGKIMKRLVDAGERVHKDQPLMRLDPTDLEQALRSAHSEVDAARASAIQTSSDEARRRILVDKGQVSQQAYERDKAAADAAAAKLAAALAQEHQAADQAAYAVLLADADGVVMETSGEPGQVVSVGQSVVRLAHDSPREAEVYIPEGEEAAKTGKAALYAHPHTWFSTKLREISAAADPQTRTFRARYVLEGDGRNAALGTTVTVRVPTDTDKPESVSVPAGAVYDDGSGPKVWVLDHATSEVAARSVRILHIGDENATVAGDLRPDERVVALGAHLLQAGEKVAIERAPIDTAAQ